MPNRPTPPPEPEADTPRLNLAAWLKLWPLVVAIVTASGAVASTKTHQENTDKRVTVLEQNKDVVVVELAKVEQQLSDQTTRLARIETKLDQGPK